MPGGPLGFMRLIRVEILQYGPHLAPGEEGNEATPGGHVGNEELHHPQQGTGERSWEQRFKNLQQELSRVKEVVRGRAPDTMDT